MPECTEFDIPGNYHGLRLDQVLIRMMPGMGRRTARRVWRQGLVLVDGRRQAAGFRVQVGQRVRVEPLSSADQEARTDASDAFRVRVAAQSDCFAALVKPAGMHSESLVGRVGTSVEGMLPELFPDRPVVLLNRLDLPVSGLVLAALTDQAACDYAVWQDQGAVRKQYLAVVSGLVDEKMEIRVALDTAKRRKVRVLFEEEPDALRWTRVAPVVHRARSDETLVLVEIYKGRRHQIRAHLSAAGHPVKHDSLYGFGPDTGWIYLHHRSISLPSFLAEDAPDWSDWRPPLNLPRPWRNPLR